MTDREIIEEMNVEDYYEKAYKKSVSPVSSDIKPEQYNIGIDTFTRMRANASYEEAMGFIRWNIDKYNTRKKNQDKDDYTKIINYCNEALWWIENENKSKTK